MKTRFKLVSVLLTVTLMMFMCVTPVAARQGGDRGRGQEKQALRHIQYLDAEVKVINGQPVIVVKTKKGYLNVPFALPEVFLVDGQTIPLQLQGNGVVVPTEDGAIVVPLEEFKVVVANGQVALTTEVNPVPVIVVGAAKIVGAGFLAGFTTQMGVNAANATWNWIRR